MNAQDLMLAQCPVLDRSDSTQHALRELCTIPGATLLPVVEAGRLVGVVHGTDLAAAATETVDTLVQAVPSQVAPHAGIESVQWTFLSKGHHDVLVVDGGQVMGLITAHAILRASFPQADVPTAVAPAAFASAPVSKGPVATASAVPLPTRVVTASTDRDLFGPDQSLDELSFQEPPSYYGDSIPAPITAAKGGSFVPDEPEAPPEPAPMDVPATSFVEAATMSGIPVRTTVLVVDDDDMMRQLQVMIAHDLGLLTLEADSLAGGRQILATDGPHIGLVLLDVHLPDGSGVTLCEEITSGQWPEAHVVPIVMVTSDDDETVMENAFFAGSVSQLHKPFEPEDLVRVIREHVVGLVSAPA